MIAPVKTPAWHPAFLEMLPSIQRHARISFRHLDAEAREELVQEVIANSLVAFLRLFSLGKAELAYPSVLARYGVAQAREGRRVGGHLNANDVMSHYAQRRRGFQVEWIDAMMPEDRTATPAEVATARIDIRAWLETLTPRNRGIARLLAVANQLEIHQTLIIFSIGLPSSSRPRCAGLILRVGWVAACSSDGAVLRGLESVAACLS